MANRSRVSPRNATGGAATGNDRRTPHWPARVDAPIGTGMADLYLKNLESERRQLWATCRLKGLAKDTPERQRIAAIDEAIAAHRARKSG